MIPRRDFLKTGATLAAASAFNPLATLQAQPSKPAQTLQFPKGFIWGTATAAYQVEGAAYEDGKGESIWDRFCKQPGAIKYGDTGEVACDHYHRYKEDLALMAELGFKNYRFSFSWPRLLPEGTGRINPKGLDFYDRLLDEMLARKITPYATMFHWDLPYILHQKGGWLNPDSSKWFEEFAALLVGHFSDRIENWFTQNESLGVIKYGYENGIQPPGYRLQPDDLVPMIHNMLLSHGRAVKVVESLSRHKNKPKCAFVTNGHLYFPEHDDRPGDVECAYRQTFNPESFDSPGWWLDPVYLGEYPAEGLRLFERFLPTSWSEDLKIIHQNLQWCAANIYSGLGVRVRQDADGRMEKIEYPGGFPRTAFDWPVVPEAIYYFIKFLHRRYQKPVLITENGMCSCDWVGLDGRVQDPQRIDFVKRYLLQVNRAIAEGADVAGYFYWSFMDNFEWQAGYSRRFGLVHVDYATQKRTVKDSGYWFRNLIASNGDVWRTFP